MKRLPLAFLFILALAALPAAAEEPITLRIDRTDAAAYPQVAVELTIRNDFGVPVPKLGAAAFDVREDRQPTSCTVTDVAPFVNPNVQLTVALAVDVSGSMAGAKLRDAQEAARRFLDRLSTQDSVALIAFAGRIDLNSVDPTREQTFSTDKTALYTTIDGLQAKGATPLHDAAFKAVQWVALQPAGNRVVLLFTDGKEEKAAGGGSQVANEDSAVREANRAGVPIFTIGLGADADEAYLKRVALETGGTYQHAAQSSELVQLFRNVSDLLKQQYRVTYTSSVPADGQTHTVQVMVKVDQHSASQEATVGPLPLLVTPAPTPTPASPTETPAPTPTPVAPQPTADAGKVVAPAPTAPAPTASTFFTTTLLGLPTWLWAGIASLALAIVALLLIRGRSGRPSEPVYRCLRCGHKLDGPDAPCPSCGFGGTYTG
ncbi:MAG: VWA domain-containing protein [Anaerolineae bacterium]